MAVSYDSSTITDQPVSPDSEITSAESASQRCW